MKLRLFHLAFVFALAIHGSAQAHDADSQAGPLGKMSFPTRCDAKVQPAFERAVAMLHSFWYSAAEMAGDRAKAAGYYRKLVELAKDSDTARPELASAKKFAQR